MKPSKEEQIEFIINGLAYKLIEKYALESANLDSYEKLIDVTRMEIFNYIKDKNIQENLFHIEPSNEDGFYAIPMNNGRFKTFEQERKVKFNECIVFGIDDTLKKYIEYKIIGNGLKNIIT